ncbi:hypothetical protein TNCV_2168491 [Trichonephila clavipes]|nr:hypothetical protein TNCV_2168491 [Trichonephila clavipes]
MEPVLPYIMEEWISKNIPTKYRRNIRTNCYSTNIRAIGDGFRNFDPVCQLTRTTPELSSPSPNYHTPPMGRRL